MTPQTRAEEWYASRPNLPGKQSDFVAAFLAGEASGYQRCLADLQAIADRDGTTHDSQNVIETAIYMLLLPKEGAGDGHA